MISVLGAAFVLVVGAALLVRREILPWILSAAVPFSATAGFTVAGQSIVVFHVVAIVLVSVEVRRHGLKGILHADVSIRPGLRPLLAFGAWALAITALAPFVFAGVTVLDPRAGIDEGVRTPASLAPALSNLAQSGYLLIVLATVIALGSARRTSPLLPAAAFAVGTVLSSVRGLLPEVAQETLFDNSANVSYTTGQFEGVERMRGIFSEPSALGSFSVAAAVFFLLSTSRVQGTFRPVFLALGCWALVNAILSYSAGALVSGLAVLAVVLAQRVYAYLRGRTVLSPGGLVGAVCLVLATVLVAPTVSTYVSAVVDDKTGSSSYENRSLADAFSYDLTTESLGLGVGLGSNRPSSFVASLSSTVGVLGTVLFVGAVALLVVGAAQRPKQTPVVAALVAVLISKIVAGPDITEPTMWFLIAICASAAWHSPYAAFAASVELTGRGRHAAGVASSMRGAP